jgi:hypothetical protein
LKAAALCRVVDDNRTQAHPQLLYFGVSALSTIPSQNDPTHETSSLLPYFVVSLF